MLKSIRALLIFALTIIIAVGVNLFVFADVIEESEFVNGNIVTEYYSSDLTEPIDDVTSVATIPVTNPPNISAKSAILIEQSTGNVLFEKDADMILPPASITKIMTMLLICEALDEGQIKMTDVVSTSEHAASMGGSQIWLEPKETMTVNELLKAVAIGSANDASVALAEFIAGSEESFVALMNEKAKKLDMKNTTFLNACGLDVDGHVSTARDVAIMSKELLKHDVIRQFTNIWMDSLRGGETELVNTNKLVKYYLGATGLKTGTTSKAGSCLSATAKRDNMEIIAVVMNCPSSKDRFSDAKKLLDYGFANWKITTPKLERESIKEIDVLMGQKNKLSLDFEALNPELIKVTDKNSVKVEISIPENVSAPIIKGQQIGLIKVFNNSKLLNEYSIYAKEDVKQIDFAFSFWKLLCAISNG